jgi:hypothetical protein
MLSANQFLKEFERNEIRRNFIKKHKPIPWIYSDLENELHVQLLGNWESQNMPFG